MRYDDNLQLIPGPLLALFRCRLYIRTCSLCKWIVPYTTAKANGEFDTNQLLTQLQLSMVMHSNYSTSAETKTRELTNKAY